MVVDKVTVIDMEIQFGERVGHRGCLIGPKPFLPKAYPACTSSKLYKLIFCLNRMIQLLKCIDATPSRCDP